MIQKIILQNYRDWAECKRDIRYSREGFPMISYEFVAGHSYGIVSDFGCGSWALCYCIGGLGHYDDMGSIMADGNKATEEYLTAHSGFIAQRSFEEIALSSDIHTVREYIFAALQFSHLDIKVDEIKNIFRLTDQRFDRPLDNTSGEIWNISIAIQYALGKDVFCFPWLNKFEFSRFTFMIDSGIIDFLKNQGKIILLPTSQIKLAKKYCDYVVQIDKT